MNLSRVLLPTLEISIKEKKKKKEIASQLQKTKKAKQDKHFAELATTHFMPYFTMPSI